ncbi:MAG: hypothetical protein IT370_17365 [Deltaproteobacteria bacterium]|nr:hypothetical protein [Deltaproteobacteria bacterium]
MGAGDDAGGQADDDSVELTGTALGRPGAPVAGWARLGAKGERRFVAGALVLRTDDGREVEITEVGRANIEPVARHEQPWHTLEQLPGASLCVADAPAPDREVELATALVLGGQRVAVFGLVQRRDFVAAATGAPTAAGAFRQPAAQQVSAVAARLLAVGDDCEDRLGRMRAAEQRAAAKAAARRATPAAAPSSSAARSPAGAASASPARPDGPLRDRLQHNLGLLIMLGCVAVAGVLVVLLPRGRDALLAMAALALTLPAVLDALMLPRFRSLGGKPLSLEAPGVAYFIGVGLALAMLLGVAQAGARPQDLDRARTMQLMGLFAGLVGVGVSLYCVATGRQRRRLIKLLADAPAHASPPADGAWGHLEGRMVQMKGTAVAGVQAGFASGVRRTWWGTATKDSTGARHRNVSDSAFEHATPSFQLEQGEQRVTVQAAGALWWSSAHIDQSTGTDKADIADVIAADCPLRVVARAQGGVLIKTGEDSLLLFAVAPGREVAATLRQLRRREQLGVALAGLGAAGLLVQLVRALVRAAQG